MNKYLMDGKFVYLIDMQSGFSYDRALELFQKGINLGSMKIPSNWQTQGLDNFNGTVWFFKEFNFKPHEDSLYILEFRGVDYIADVWINSFYKTHHEGYFQFFYCDISEQITKKNLIVIKVTSPKEDPDTVWPLKKKLIKGIFNHHDCRPGGWSYDHGQDKNTGGIWNSVILHEMNSVYVENTKITPLLNEDYSRAVISVDIRLYAKKTFEDKLKIRIKSASGKEFNFKQIVAIFAEKQSIKLKFEISNPELWWSWDLGEQNLYDLSIKGSYIFVEESFGIREVKLDKNNAFYLNNKRLFLRGTNVIPEQFLSLLTPEKINTQVHSIKDANINIIRMHAHVNRKEYYDECDRQGILVWQDFALQWTYDASHEFAAEASKQVKEMVLLHYNHPSIAFWCCHNEPGEQIMTLDPLLYDAVLSEDNTRIIRSASNYEEHPYDGWYWGNMEHFAACPMGPLVTEFGAQALPELSTLKKFLTPKEIAKTNWAKWKYHNFQYEQTFHIAGVIKGKNIKEFVNNSQEYQSRLLQTAIDFYRRERFNKVTAVFQFMFIDCWPSITWSVVDYFGKKKAGYFTLKKAFQPLYISIKLMRGIYFPGDKLNINIWVINDFHKEFETCSLEFILDLKLLGAIDVTNIPGNSIQNFRWEENIIYLPKKISAGFYEMVVLLRDKKSKILSVNTFNVKIEKPVKVIYR